MSNPFRLRRGARGLAALLVLSACAAPSNRAVRPEAGSAAPQSGETEAEDDSEGRSILTSILLYLPNRVFDVFDLVRARARVGPGLSADVRATELADVFVGAHSTVWAGLPGPRTRPAIPLPVGLEIYSGAGVSVVEAEAAAAHPHYGAGEIGLGFQAAIVGLAVGVDPLEIVDLVTGLFFVDLVGDDF